MNLPAELAESLYVWNQRRLAGQPDPTTAVRLLGEIMDHQPTRGTEGVTIVNLNFTEGDRHSQTIEELSR